jgi:hypothetical protein
MKKVWILTLLTAISVFCFTGKPIHSQDKPEKFWVYVSVTCDDEDTKNLIESHIKRELRSLQDISIFSFPDFAEYILMVVVVERSNLRGGKTGEVAIAYSIQERFDVSKLKEHCPGGKPIFLGVNEEVYKMTNGLVIPN